jgi:hypothetical protein
MVPIEIIPKGTKKLFQKEKEKEKGLLFPWKPRGTYFIARISIGSLFF